MTDTTISGEVVVKLTSVPPMTTRGILSTSAMRTAAETNRSPPWIISAKPATNNVSSINIRFRFKDSANPRQLRDIADPVHYPHGLASFRYRSRAKNL